MILNSFCIIVLSAAILMNSFTQGRTYKKQSEDLGFLQNWLLSQLEAA